jgi:Na+-transporting methylmalonyl-CoA/oxaloacetate decarboxylase gamma subunit
MRRPFVLIVLALLTSVIVACGAATPTAAPAAAPTTAPTAATAARATVSSAGATVPAAGASASASVTAPPAFIDGTIQSLTADRVTLADGQSFAVTARTSYVNQVVAQASDLVPGVYIGIKGKKQADGTLLATLIDIFGQKGAGNQFPLIGGDLMTNATIDKVEGTKLTVSFTGGGAFVTLAPNVQIYRDQAGVVSDVKTGSMVTIVVSNGAAGAIRVH